MTELTGSCVSLFHGVISCGSEALFFGLAAWRETVESVSQVELSFGSLCRAPEGDRDVEEKLLVQLGQAESEGK